MTNTFKTLEEQRRLRRERQARWRANAAKRKAMDAQADAVLGIEPQATIEPGSLIDHAAHRLHERFGFEPDLAGRMAQAWWGAEVIPFPGTRDAADALAALVRNAEAPMS